MNYFLEVYGSLPRAGPGSDALTRRAFGMIPDLPLAPRILDVGCGPGMQTIELLKNCGGTVVALDFLPEMIARVKNEARTAGVSERLETVLEDMRKMSFPAHSFDVIWSEGAIYNMGFEAGLEAFRKFLKPGGYVAVSEAVWLKPDPPARALEFWKDYPEIDTVAAKLDVIERVGFEAIGHFIFPASAWIDQYYEPMEKRIGEKEREWQGIPEAEAVLDEASREVSVFRECSDYFSYAFFIVRG